MANYHPSDELLMQFAAGQAPNALGLIIACHLEKCQQCRTKVRMYERLGGDILSELAPQPVSDGILDSVLQRIERPEPSKSATIESNIQIDLPKPLRRFITKSYDELEWTGFSKSIQEYNLPFSDEQFTAKLYRISAGKELPEHTHEGNEFTLVMEGSFCDKAGDYNEGDFILADTHTRHQPKAKPDADCICFAVMDAPLKMTGFFGRMLNPFMR